jgi:hypothetical protein
MSHPFEVILVDTSHKSPPALMIILCIETPSKNTFIGGQSFQIGGSVTTIQVELLVFMEEVKMVVVQTRSVLGAIGMDIIGPQAQYLRLARPLAMQLSISVA